MQYLNSTRSPLAPSSDFFGPHLVNLSVEHHEYGDIINPHTHTTPYPECVHILGPSMGVKCETDSFDRKMTSKHTVKIFPTKQFLILDYNYCLQYQ